MQAIKIIDYIKTLIPEIEIVEKKDYYVLPTICHNKNHEEASHKLYLYKNEDTTPLFTCYTECGDTFNVYTFIQRFFKLRNETLTYKEAYKKMHGHDFEPVTPTKEYTETSYNTEFINPLSVELNEYSPGVLDLFQTSPTDPWSLEGIDLDILKKYQIGYSKSYEGVTIPHFDWRGRLIGLRIRTYNPYKIEHAKYMPAKIGNIFYRHPLSLNLFGLYQNQSNIKEAKTVILAESEKSVLQWDTMSEDPNIALAICGQRISKWQMDVLIYFLGVENVVIAFDKEYSNYTEAFEYVEKIKKQVNFLSNFANIYVLIDENNKFKLKESPFDRTISEFESLKFWKINF